MSEVKKSTLIFIVLSVIASGLSYITYPILSRLLSPEQYTDITLSLSLLTQVTTFLSSIIAITIGLAKGSGADSASRDINKLQAMLFRFFAILSLIFLATSPLLMPLIKTPVAYSVSICLAMLASIPLAVISGYLNGRNMLIKVGVVGLLVASMQFILGITTASITRDGVWTMTLMSIAQFIAVLLLYRIFSKQGLPNLRHSLSRVDFKSKTIKDLALYTFFASLAIMAVNLLQITDLLMVERISDANIKLYTDIYVISRVVFFAGMIFIWPFLSLISLTDHMHNIRIIYKLILLFFMIAFGAAATMYLFGDSITLALFNADYDRASILTTSSLSIFYKFLLLILTAIILYLIVLRSYAAITFAVLSVLASAVAVAVTTHMNINQALIILNVSIASIVALSVAYASFMKKEKH